MHRNALLPALLLLMLSGAATTAVAITRDADVLQLNYSRPKSNKAAVPVDHRPVSPAPPRDHHASTKLGHR